MSFGPSEDGRAYLADRMLRAFVEGASGVHPDAQKCVCQGRGRYYVSTPIDTERPEVPCSYHDRAVVFTESDRQLLNDLGIS